MTAQGGTEGRRGLERDGVTEGIEGEERGRSVGRSRDMEKIKG